MAYTHLSLEERHYIEIQRKEGTSLNKIARALGRAQSSVSREVHRNTGLRGYRHKQAQLKMQERHQEKPKMVKLTSEIKRQIEHEIKNDWSPEQIAGRFKRDGIIKLHHETIYQLIIKDKQLGGKLYKHLRHQNKTYRKRYGSPHNRTGIPNRVDIDERPEEANKRLRVGDLEADTIIGKGHKGAILTLDDRRSKLRLAAPLPAKKAKEIRDAMIGLLIPIKLSNPVMSMASWTKRQGEVTSHSRSYGKELQRSIFVQIASAIGDLESVIGIKPIQQFIKTVTYDNGKEFVEHEMVAKALTCKSYFAKPYHSWEGRTRTLMGYSGSTSPNQWRSIRSLKRRFSWLLINSTVGQESALTTKHPMKFFNS